MINLKMSNVKDNENIINIFVIFVSLFILTIIPINKVPVNYQNADIYNGELTAYSLNIVNNWLKDGIINDKFVTYCDFASVEFENNNNRCVYLSYPPGAFLPIYLIARGIAAEEISISFIKYFILFEYYLSMLLLGLLFYVCLKILEFRSRLFMIVLPVIFSSLWAFLPYNLFYMKNIYFTDQAVILLSIVFFLIEFTLYNKQLEAWKHFLQILSCVVLFAGILTDYYFYCIAFVAIIFRIWTTFQDYPEKSLLYKLFSNTWTLIMSAIVASTLFLIQLLLIPNGLKLLVLTFFIRADSGADFGGINGLINHFNIGFSFFSIPILMITLIYCFIFPLIRNKYGKDKQMLMRCLSIIVLSTVLHTVILREHSIIHEFSMLKYNLVFVFIMFALSCWLYINYLNSCEDRKRRLWKVLFHFSIGLVIILILTLQIYNRNFYSIRMNTADHSIARFIKANSNYYDVVYSPDYEINWNPPQDLAISKKRVYKVSSLHEIPHNHLPAQAVINILISRDSLENENWNKLMRQKNYLPKSDHLYLFKIPRKSFQAVVQ